MPCMTKLQFKNKWVLVTGASSGLGAEIARQLAANHGANLILLARRKDKLEQLKSELEENTGNKVRILIAQLGSAWKRRGLESLGIRQGQRPLERRCKATTRR